MTAEEFSIQKEWSWVWMDRNIADIRRMMEEYHNYKAKAVIEAELSEDWIYEQGSDRSSTGKQIAYYPQIPKGIKIAKTKLLKRLKKNK